MRVEQRQASTPPALKPRGQSSYLRLRLRSKEYYALTPRDIDACIIVHGGMQIWSRYLE